jgi:hypothetical protein
VGRVSGYEWPVTDQIPDRRLRTAEESVSTSRAGDLLLASCLHSLHNAISDEPLRANPVRPARFEQSLLLFESCRAVQRQEELAQGLLESEQASVCCRCTTPAAGRSGACWA